MNRLTWLVACALILLGCSPAQSGGSAPPSGGSAALAEPSTAQSGEPAAPTDGPFALVTSWEPGSASGHACRATWWVDGLLIFDPKYGMAIIEETQQSFAAKGSTVPVLWWPIFTGWRAGSEVSVLDSGGTVIAITGRRYTINGSFEQVGFVACGDEVTPK